MELSRDCNSRLYSQWNRKLYALQTCQTETLYRAFMVFAHNRDMTVLTAPIKDLHTAARTLNQRAEREKWYYFCDPSLGFSDDYHVQLLNLWRNKSEGGAMPKRSAFTPRDLKDVLRNIVMFERVEHDPSRYRWRLIGTNLTNMAGDNTGKMFDETLSPDHVTRWTECADLILGGTRPLRFIGRVHLKGREYLDAENLFVPLSNDNGEPTFVMGLCRYTPRHSENEESWENQIASIPGSML